VIALSVLSVLGLLVAIALIPLGLRAGDRSDDPLLVNVEPRVTPRGANLTVTNPGRESVVLGVSLRRAGLRLRLEGRSYVRLRTGSMSSDLRASEQTGIAVLEAGETETFVVAAGGLVAKRAELTVVVGQADRLRTIHRLVVLPGRELGENDARHQVRKPGLEPLER
jgi:hypothetical protein